jgi:DNA invertase Pin-like site-specific DNA recombinase
MLIGYARVSTNEQNLDLQRDALLRSGVSSKSIYTDKVTGVKSERPGLKQALSHLREGDTLIVWRLDRLGRSLKHLIETVTTLKNQGVSFKSLTENIDTSTATGTLVFQIFGALAEFERNLITERTVAGLESARMRGRKGGRPPRNPASGRANLAKRLYSDQSLTISDILKTLNVSKSTLYRWLDLPTDRQDLNRGKREKP